MTNESSSGFWVDASGSAATAWPRLGAKSTKFRPPSSLTNVTPGSPWNTSGPAPLMARRSTPDASNRDSMAANFSVSDGASKSVPQLYPSSSPKRSSAPARITPFSSARFAYELNLARVFVLSRNSVPTERRLGRSPGVAPPALLIDSVSLVTSDTFPRSSAEPYSEPADAMPKSERLSWRACTSALLPPARSIAFMRSRRDFRDSSCFRTMICARAVVTSLTRRATQTRASSACARRRGHGSASVMSCAFTSSRILSTSEDRLASRECACA